MLIKKIITGAKQKYKSKNLEFIQSDLEKLKLAKRADVVISLQTIEHYKDTELFIVALKKLIKKETIIISTPNKKTQSGNENPYHYREFTSQELKSLLGKHFEKFEIFGLHGDSKFQKYEQKRASQVEKILSWDKFRLRQRLSRQLRQQLFDMATWINRYWLSLRQDVTDFSEENFVIKSMTDGAIDLIAVVKI